MSRTFPVEVPEEPVPVEQVIERIPYVRQSVLSRFDECKLTTLLELRHGGGWDGHPQARGHLFHRFAAEALRTLRRQGETRMPVAEALEILYEVVRQRLVPPEDRVRVPMRQLRELRMAVIKWANDNTFSTDRIMSIEQRYNAPVTYVSKEGELVTRLLTGQLDVLIADPPDGAVVIDWKDTWGLPPANTRGVPDAPEDDGSHLSYSGYFQQRFYALLVMHNFPAVQTVKLREFYHRHATAREGIVTRDSLEHVTRELSVLVADFDETVAAGAKHAGTLSREDPWRPSPGNHCSMCPKPASCPIEREARGEGAIDSDETAQRYAGEFEVATQVRAHRMKALKPWTSEHGPVELASSKGRRAVGMQQTHTLREGVKRRGTRFGTFTPEESDRGAEPDDAHLEQALQESIEEVERVRASR
jgi:hypothetical protein